MNGAYGQFYEISQLLAGDARGGQLADDLLNACFDYVLPEDGGEGSMASLAHLMAALERFNLHIQREGEGPASGLFIGTPEEVAAWAEDLTWQIWENRPN